MVDGQMVLPLIRSTGGLEGGQAGAGGAEVLGRGHVFVALRCGVGGEGDENEAHVVVLRKLQGRCRCFGSRYSDRASAEAEEVLNHGWNPP